MFIIRWLKSICFHRWQVFQHMGRARCLKCGMIYDDYEGKYYKNIGEFFNRSK